MGKIKAGDLSRRIQIYSGVDAQSGFGSTTKIWSLLKIRCGSITELSGRELVQAQRVHAEVTHEIILRYYQLPKLDATYRFIHRDEIFNILAVLHHDQDREYFKVLVKQFIPKPEESFLVDTLGNPITTTDGGSILV